MPFTLDDVVPWGRSYAEYREMFELEEADLDRTILGCADGPASFNCELNARGGHPVSVDPLYEYNPRELRGQIESTYEKVIREARKNVDQFHWDEIKSVEEMGKLRMQAMQEFLGDLQAGKEEGRYIVGRLPTLPFEDKQFDLALCAHFLFLYTDRLGIEFHIESLSELARVATEVRVFPLLDLDAKRSRYVDDVVDALESAGYETDLRRVRYEFRKGGNELLTVRSGQRPS